jgi:ACS family hexuronate transporter-like MFS transporter
MASIPVRWIAVVVFGLYSALNYLDRQTLTALAPQLKSEFTLTNTEYGWLHAAFYVVYGAVAPFAGLMLDRLGLSQGAMLMIVMWSFAAVLTGFVEGFAGLVACRMLLGAAEAGGIPAFGKAVATYLEPSERAVGLGLNQLGISVGGISASLLAAWIAAVYGWRAAFIATGLIGFLWLPLWKLAEKAAGPGVSTATTHVPTPMEMIRDSRLWALVIANMLIMTVYSLWTHWITILLVDRYKLTQLEANQRYAWIPPVFATAGGFFGGWLSMRMIVRGKSLLAARGNTMLIGAVAVLATMAAPHMPGPGAAMAVASFSFFWCLAISSNMYALPQDLFGARRAGFGIAAITSAYGFLQIPFLPAVGWLVDRYGFNPVCMIAAFLPLAGWLLLRATALRPEAAA